MGGGVGATRGRGDSGTRGGFPIADFRLPNEGDSRSPVWGVEFGIWGRALGISDLTVEISEGVGGGAGGWGGELDWDWDCD